MVPVDVRSEGSPDFIYEQTRYTQDELVISIRDKLEKSRQNYDKARWRLLCIYKIPNYMQQRYDRSYRPETVSLGPYHHGSLDYLPMELHKWRAVDMVLRRTVHPIETYFDVMREIEGEARACYQGSISFTSHDFAEMLVLDGLFTLEILRGSYKKEGFLELGYDRNDPVFVMQTLMQSIQRDMLVLENQLPLFVLNELLKLELGSENHTFTVAQLAVHFFHTLIPTDEPSTNIQISLEKDNFFNLIADNAKGEMHCLNVFRQYLLRPGSKESNREPRLSQRRKGLPMFDHRQKQMIYSVMDLKNAGINFRMRKTDRFWDVRFNNGSLEIPKIVVHAGTKSLFLNLIAFEQLHINSSNDITSYIVFMDNLINTDEDVTYLRSRGIIQHWLESDYAVADLFNQLGQEIVLNISDSYLSELSTEACRYYFHHHKYYRIWNGWKNALIEKYFNSPWGFMSFFAAIILMILTLAQCYFAGYAYYKSP